MKKFILFLSQVILMTANSHSQGYFFSFSRQLFGTPSTLTIWIQSFDPITGDVVINGVDTQCPTTPFTWIWDDNSNSTGFFPQSHSYANHSRNYVLKVISHYSATQKDTAELVIWFVAPQISPVSLNSDYSVFIPDHDVSFSTRLYPLPSCKSWFTDNFFTLIPRSTIEYVLSAASNLQMDFTNQNTYLVNGKFEQYIMRDSTFNGAYSIWFSDPVSFYSGDAFFTGSIGYSSLFHEMGHNFTLNTPGSYYYGGKIDGNANAIFAESMAQIYQHATGYEFVNNFQTYGISTDLMTEIKLGLISTMNMVRNSYDAYLNSGMIYQSWNDPATPVDETFNTFMTVAYKFFEKAETSGMGYKVPLKRMLSRLQYFNPDWQQMYDPLNNSAKGSVFRSTLLVSAMSYGFETDLREEFRALNFPVEDSMFNAIYNIGTGVESGKESAEINIYPNPAQDYIIITNAGATGRNMRIDFYNSIGKFVSSRDIQSGEKISLSDLPIENGLILLKIKSHNSVTTKRNLRIR